jgi:hypothetical protein
MYPQLHINYVAVIAAVAASFVFGWLWYGPLFGKQWARLMNLSLDDIPEPRKMLRSMALGVLGTFLIAYVLAHNILVWHPSVWGAGTDAPAYMYGLMSGFFTWIGYFVPMLLGAVAWEGRSWGLFTVNAGYQLVNLQIIAMILAYGS